jgi:hypothetical protein
MAERGGHVAQCGARLHRPTGRWFSVDGGGGGAVEVRGLSFLRRGWQQRQQGASVTAPPIEALGMRRWVGGKATMTSPQRQTIGGQRVKTEDDNSESETMREDT